MPENRQIEPLISNLVVNTSANKTAVQTEYVSKATGERLVQVVLNEPSIVCEIIPFIGPYKAPAVQFAFPSRDYFQAKLERISAPAKAVAELEAIPEADRTSKQKVALVQSRELAKQNEPYIADLTEFLAREDLTWAEDLLPGLKLETLWDDVLNVALNMFTEWSDAKDSKQTGCSVQIKPLAWNARIAAFPTDPTVLDLTIGLFTTPDNEPTQLMLSFEDKVAKALRLKSDASDATTLKQFKDQLAVATDEQEIERLEQNVKAYEDKVAALAKVERGSFEKLFSELAVASTVPQLMIAILTSKQAKTLWPDANIATISQAVAAKLTALTALPQEPE